MSTRQYVVKAIDVIPGDEYSRALLVALTEEGDTVVLFLNPEDEPDLRADAAVYLRGR